MAKDNNLRDFLQGVANAIRNKKGTSGDINAQDFESEIASISDGGMTYEDYARTLYLAWGKSNQFMTAWQKQIDSKNVIYDIDVTLVAPNQEMGGMYLDLYIGDSDLTQLYNDCVNQVIPLPSSGNLGDIYLINNVAVKYFGEISGDSGFPIPLFEFGSMEDVNGFIIADLTPLEMGLGITLAKITSVAIPNNKLTIQQGFDFEEPFGIILPDSVTSIDVFAFYDWTSNNQPLVIPNSVTSISEGAFQSWTSNNQPLVIPNSVTSISEGAFQSWTSNNQPLVIPNSVTSIGEYAFRNWTSNNQPLVIPDSVTSIGTYAFQSWSSNNQPLVIPNSVTSIESGAFYDWTSNNQPLVIPNSVTSIGDYAFYNWQANNQPLVIPDSVTSIGASAFRNWSLVPYIEIQAITPPTLADANAFGNQNDAPIYVPDSAVNTYKNATNWVSLADRIFSINDK